MTATREYLQSLADQPINSAARANKLWLPEGKTMPAPRSEEDILASRANASAARAHDKERQRRRIDQLLDYYATTSVPTNRVAEHCGIAVEEALRGLKARGRA